MKVQEILETHKANQPIQILCSKIFHNRFLLHKGQAISSS